MTRPPSTHPVRLSTPARGPASRGIVRWRRPTRWLVGGLVVTLALAGCGAGPDATQEPTGDARVRVVATTAVLGDLVTQVMGDAGVVTVLMDGGQDPHTFQLSAQQAGRLRDADLVVANGLGLEAGIADSLDQVRADGTPVREVGPDLDPLPAGRHDPDEAHDHEGDADHDDGGAWDPHVWLDVGRMARAPAIVAEALDEVADGPWEANAADARHGLEELDSEVAAVLDEVPARCRRVATDHDVFHYLGDRYGVEVPVTVVPGTSTDAEPSAREVADAVDAIEEEGIRVLVVEDTASTRRADAVAADSRGALTVVALPLATPDGPSGTDGTYAGMMRTVATGLAEALAACG